MSFPVSEAEIRRAHGDDAAGIAALFDEYRQFYGQSADLGGAHRFIESRLQAGDSVLFVADRSGHLVGFTQLYPSFSSVSMKRLWILNDLFVQPESRRSGVGQRLMAAAEAFAATSGSKGLILSTQKTNAKAKALYESRAWQLDPQFDHYERFF